MIMYVKNTAVTGYILKLNPYYLEYYSMDLLMLLYKSLSMKLSSRKADMVICSYLKIKNI